MNQKYIVQSENVPSSPSTGTDFSQELSPFRRDSQDAVHLLEGQCPTLSQLFSEDSIMSVNRNIQKPIFKIIRETKQQPKTNLDSDLGNYNRKDKSLGELSRKLLVMFGKFEECSISLDVVTQQLGVERRRIYDIINILESLGVVYRKRKNSYQWKGLKSIQGTLKKLQQQNFKEGDLNEEIDSDGEETQQSQARIKREKSLGLLSTGFIKLFFSWKKIISLEEAGRKLSANNIEENKIRTKIRRLYDIANVFSSLGLIHKTCLDTKKPAYQWIGSAGLEAFMQRLNTCSDETQIFFEIDPKKKEKECLAKEEQAQENPPCFSIQSNNSAFKAFESVIQNSNPVDNLLTALLNLYKGSAEKKEVSTQVCTNKDLNLPNFTIKSCKPIQKNVELAVPKIKKSVSIIQKVNLENSVSALTEGFFGKAQKACTSNSTTGFKRRVIGHNDSLEENLVKKICSFKNFERKIAF